MIINLTVEQLVGEKNVRNASKQTDVFKINRYVFVILSVVILILVGRSLVGWPNMAEMLYESGAYDWLCTKEEKEAFLLMKGDLKVLFGGFSCHNQRIAVTSLYSTVYTALMVSSGIAGILMYFIGSKFTFIFGSLMMLTGWCVLAFSNAVFRGFEAGIVLISLGMDPIVFGLLSCVNTFPGNEVFVTGIMAAATSLSMMIPGLIRLCSDRAGLKPQSAFLIFGLTVHLLMVLFGIFCVPGRRFYKQQEIDEAAKRLDEFGNIEMHFNVKNGLKSPSISDVESPNKILTNEAVQPQEDLIDKGSRSKLKDLFRCKGKFTRVPWYLTLAIVFHFLCTVTQGAHIMNMLMISYSGIPAEILVYGLPLSFIPCLYLGYMTDKHGVSCVLWYEITGILFSLALMVFVYYPLGIAAAVFFAFTNACLTGQFWFIIVDLYEPNIQMFVLGAMSLVSGLGTLFERLLFPAVAHSVALLQVTVYAFLAIGLIQGGLVFAIIKLREKVVSGTDDRNSLVI